LKSTIGNITLINRFRKKNEEAEVSPEEHIFNFWMEYFIEGINEDVGEEIRFPVSNFYYQTTSTHFLFAGSNSGATKNFHAKFCQFQPWC